jgi:hypothetical protein
MGDNKRFKSEVVETITSVGSQVALHEISLTVESAMFLDYLEMVSSHIFLLL